MLSSVLNSERAIAVNIQIMRTFTKLREMLATHKELKQKIEEMEKKYDAQFKIVYGLWNSRLLFRGIQTRDTGFSCHERRARCKRYENRIRI